MVGAGFSKNAVPKRAGNVVLWLVTANEFERVMAVLKDSDARAAASLRKGTKLTLLCTGGTRIVGSPTVDDCIIRR
jgi:hypothetical protein